MLLPTLTPPFPRTVQYLSQTHEAPLKCFLIPLTRNWLGSIDNDFVSLHLSSLYDQFSNYLYCSHNSSHHTRTDLIKYMCKYRQKCELFVSSFHPQIVGVVQQYYNGANLFSFPNVLFWSQSSYTQLPKQEQNLEHRVLDFKDWDVC